MAPATSLRLFLFAPGKLRELDSLDRHQRLMKCCPACAGPLVLFNEKFGEVNGVHGQGVNGPGSQEKHRRTSSTSGPSGKGSPDGTSITELPTEEKQGPPGQLHGGWYCSDCGVHIIPERAEAPRRDSARQPSLRQSSRSMEDLKVNTSIGAKKRSSSQPASPKSKALDDQYEALEKQLRDSFMTLIGHIREHYSQKEEQLKEYQVDLCQREKILRANEEHLNQRINRLRQSEDVVRRKMERLSLYKSSMLSQLEAKSQQLGRWERGLQQWEAKLRGSYVLPEKPAPDVGSHGFREAPREAPREPPREPLGRSVAKEEQRPWHSRHPSGSTLNLSRTDLQTPKAHHQESQLNRQQSQTVIYDYPPNNQPKSPPSSLPTSPRQLHPAPPRDAYYHPVQQQDYRTQGLPNHSAMHRGPPRHPLSPGSRQKSPGRGHGRHDTHNKSYGKDDTVNASDLSMTNYMSTSYGNGSAKPSPDSGYTSVNHGYPTGTGPPAYRQVSAHQRPPRLQYQSSQVSLLDASDHESVHATSPRMTSSYHVLDHSIELEEFTDSQGRRVYRRVTEI